MVIRHEQRGQGGIFVASEGEQIIGEMTYGRHRDGPMEIDHTWVDPRARGQGLARQLVEAGITHARAQGLKILPLCSYVVKVFDEEPNLAPLRARR